VSYLKDMDLRLLPRLRLVDELQQDLRCVTEPSRALEDQVAAAKAQAIALAEKCRHADERLAQVKAKNEKLRRQQEEARGLFEIQIHQQGLEHERAIQNTLTDLGAAVKRNEELAQENISLQSQAESRDLHAQGDRSELERFKNIAKTNKDNVRVSHPADSAFLNSSTTTDPEAKGRECTSQSRARGNPLSCQVSRPLSAEAEARE
jgi:hypothetical protein